MANNTTGKSSYTTRLHRKSRSMCTDITQLSTPTQELLDLTRL